MEERNLRKTRVGVVVSDKMEKTIVVAVKNNERHPLYNKIVKTMQRSVIQSELWKQDLYLKIRDGDL